MFREKKKPVNSQESNQVNNQDDGEDEESVTCHQKWMADEIRKRQPNVQGLQQRMSLTFAKRRQWMTENPPPTALQVAQAYPVLIEYADSIVFLKKELEFMGKSITDFGDIINSEKLKKFLASKNKSVSIYHNVCYYIYVGIAFYLVYFLLYIKRH